MRPPRSSIFSVLGHPAEPVTSRILPAVSSGRGNGSRAWHQRRLIDALYSGHTGRILQLEHCAPSLAKGRALIVAPVGSGDVRALIHSIVESRSFWPNDTEIGRAH